MTVLGNCKRSSKKCGDDALVFPMSPSSPSLLNFVEGKPHQRLAPGSGLPRYLSYCSNLKYFKFVLFPLSCILIKIASFIFRIHKTTTGKRKASQMFKYPQVTMKLRPKLVFHELADGRFCQIFVCVTAVTCAGVSALRQQHFRLPAAHNRLLEPIFIHFNIPLKPRWCLKKLCRAYILCFKNHPHLPCRFVSIATEPPA